MSAITSTATLPRRTRSFGGRLAPLVTLTHRRFSLAARTPRELLVPLLTPVLFAVLIGPALKNALHAGAQYEAYVAIGTLGLLIPLNTMFLGIGVIVDRENGAQRELLAAPIPRALLVLGNLLVALTVTGLQIVALLGAARARGVSFHVGSTGALWFLGTVLLFTIGMYGASETLASRILRQEEFIARVPPIAIVPWFLAGALFPITALPLALTWVAKFLPITHALALMRYGLLGDSSSLHTIWQSSNATAMAGLSFAVVAAFGALLTVVAVRAFGRSAVQ